MADEKETKQDELQDLDPKKDPKGGVDLMKQKGGQGGSGRGETPRLDK